MKATFFVVPNNLDRQHNMTREQIKELSDSGVVSIQSHSLTHANMTKLSASQQEYEMKESQRQLRELTGKSPIALTYPEGDTRKPRCRSRRGIIISASVQAATAGRFPMIFIRFRAIACTAPPRWRNLRTMSISRYRASLPMFPRQNGLRRTSSRCTAPTTCAAQAVTPSSQPRP